MTSGNKVINGRINQMMMQDGVIIRNKRLLSNKFSFYWDLIQTSYFVF